MKTTKFWITALLALSLQSPGPFAQAFDEERMKKEIEIAETVLGALIKQEMSNQNTIFGLDVKGAYIPGYGVTFRLPSDHSMPFVVRIAGDELRGASIVSDGNGYRYSIRANGSEEQTHNGESVRLKEKTEISADSVRNAYYENMINAARSFILDYGDLLLSQLSPQEKIVVTNQSDRPQFFFSSGKRTRISVEGTRQDVIALRQGKISREQALEKLTIVNTESVETREPDMEMLSSIFSRLYRPDLSTTYFLQGNVYYERLRDFGAIFYMQMVSSSLIGPDSHAMPTVGLQGLDQEARDKKVAELYPAFEQDIKENILEYGRTVKTLKGDESLIFNISLTSCRGCGIPATLEVAIKSSILEAFGSGKIDKTEAMARFSVKKGPNQ